MLNKSKSNEIKHQQCLKYLKKANYFFIILSVVCAFIGLLILVFGNKTNTKTTDSTETVAIIFDESFSFVFEMKNNDMSQIRQQLSKNDSFYSFFSSIVSLCGLSNIIISSLIVSKAKYKYGYIIYDLLNKNLLFSEWLILYYFIVLCFDYLAIEFYFFAETILFSAALISELVSFVLIYYICNLSKKAIQVLIEQDLDKKIHLAINNNEISNYKEISDCCQKIVKFVTSQKDSVSKNDWLFACDCLLKIVYLDKSVTIEEQEDALTKLLNSSRFDYRIKDTAIIFYKNFSDLYSCYAEKNRPLNVNSLDCLHEFFSHICYSQNSTRMNEPQWHTVLVSVALWLFLDVDDQEALNILNDLVISDNKILGDLAPTVITLCYLYAHVFFYAADSTFYDNSRFQYIYKRVTSDKFLINRVLSKVHNNRGMYSKILLLFKTKLISCSTLDNRFIYSSYFPTLHTRVLLNMTQTEKDSSCYDLIDEIYSYFYITN